MKKAVDAIKRFPFCLVMVSVNPMTRPHDQFIQVPVYTTGPIPVFEKFILESGWVVAQDGGGSHIRPFL